MPTPIEKGICWAKPELDGPVTVRVTVGEVGFVTVSESASLKVALLESVTVMVKLKLAVGVEIAAGVPLIV